MFLMGVDAAGDVQWATDHKRQKRAFFHRRATDNYGNVYEAGRASGRVTLTKHSGEGLHQWSRDWAGRGDAAGNAVATDSYGNVYVLGHFSGDLKVGDIDLTSIGTCATYINKLNGAGDVLWSVRIEGTSPGKVTGYAITIDDSAGHVLITGAFDGTLMYGSEKLQSTGGLDVFVMRLDSHGNVLWAMSAGGEGQDSGNSIAADKYGNLYVTGSFSGTAQFGERILESRGDLDVFTMKLSSI